MEGIQVSISAMKQALDALKWINDEQAIISYEAVTALRQAIAEAEKQDGWILREVYFEDGEPISHREPQPVHASDISQERVDETAKCGHEPVAWMYETGTFWDRTPHWRFLESAEQTKGLRTVQALYTAPPKREWVGLTDEEVFLIREYPECCEVSIRNAEAKLKEKNT
jgi:hypothetical protein